MVLLDMISLLNYNVGGHEAAPIRPGLGLTCEFSPGGGGLYTRV